MMIVRHANRSLILNKIDTYLIKKRVSGFVDVDFQAAIIV